MSSGTVDTKTVEMRFDNSNFEQNAKQSMSTLEKLKRALKLDGASAGLKEVERASNQLHFGNLEGGIDSVAKKFDALSVVATGALLEIGKKAADAGIKIAKSLTIDQVASGWNKYAEKTTAVQTIMANLRDEEASFVDEAEKLDYVNTYLNKLLWFSDETSYSFTDMTNNVGKFIANGQGLKESVTAMQGIATWAAISGQNSQTAARAMYNISQAMGTGAMQVKDWMSIENANMATAQFKELAITIGQKQGKIEKGTVTIENFRDSLSGGKGKDAKKWFDKDVMMEVFETYGEAANRIQEYAEAHNVTSTEAIREIKKTDKEFADSLGFKAFAAAQEAKTFSEVVSATADAVSTKWMKIFENIFGNYLEAKELWTDLSEQMWEIFAAPLDTLNDIMTEWNRGFFADGPKSVLQRWFESGRLGELENDLHYVTKEVAEAAVASDKATYSIEQLDNGTKVLIKTTKLASGEYKKQYKEIYESDEALVSGRTKLIESFQNIFDAFVHDVYDENGELESVSFLGSLKRGLQEFIFGTSDIDEIVPKVSRKLWEMTNKFSELTARLKPSAETSEKIKNSFKGFLTLFKTVGKVIGAIAKPFKDLLGDIFKNAPKDILHLSDAVGTWAQKLDKFLTKNKVFDKISEKVSAGLNKMKAGADKLSIAFTGMTVSELADDLKNKLFGFFENFDFQGNYDKVTGFFNGLSEQMEQVKTGNLPEAITPFQKFLVRAKQVSDGFKSLFKTPGSDEEVDIISVVNQFRQFKNGELPETLTPFQQFLVTGKNVFENVKGLFEKISGIFSSIKEWISKPTDLDGIKGIFSKIGEIFSSAKDKFQDIGGLDTIFNAIGTLFDSITGFLTDIFKANGLADFLKMAGKIGLVGLLADFINSFYTIWVMRKKISWIPDTIYGIVRGVEEATNSFTFEHKSAGYKNLAAAILMLTGAIAILSFIKPADIAKGLITIGLMIGLFWMFSKLTKSFDKMSLVGAGASLNMFAFSMLILTGVVYLLGSMDSNKVYRGITALALMVLVFALFGKLTNKAEGIGKASRNFLLFSIAVDILAIGVNALSKLNPGGLVTAVGAIALLVLIFAMLGKLSGKAEGLGTATRNFLLFSVAVDILSLGTAHLSKMDPIGLTGAVAAIAILVLIFSLLGKLSGKAEGLGTATRNFLLFSVAVDILSLGVGHLSKMDPIGLTGAVAAIGILVLIFSLLGKLSGKAEGLGTATRNFLLFSVAVDILSLGTAHLSKMDTIGLAGAVAAIASLVLIFALLGKLSGKAEGLGTATRNFLLFSVAVDILSLGVGHLSKMDPVGLAGAVAAIASLVLIFALLGKLSGKAEGLGSAAAKFILFGVAVDILSLGTAHLSKMDPVGLAGAVAAIASLVLIFALLNKLSGSSANSISSAKSFLAFSVAIIAISFGLSMLVPVMQQIDSMGDSWWKPLVFFGAAIAILLGAAAITGIPLVGAGLTVLANAMFLIGAACLMAGVGIGVAAAGLALLAIAAATYGPQAAMTIGASINFLLATIIASAPMIALAAAALIKSFAMGVVMSADVLVSSAITLIVTFVLSVIDTLISLIPALVDGFVGAINAMAEAIRYAAPLLTEAMLNLLESLVEAVLVGIATIVEPWGGVGAAISDKIMKWIPGIREAFGVIEGEAADGAENAADAYSDSLDGFSGGGGGHRFSNEEEAEESGKADAEAYKKGFMEEMAEKYGISTDGITGLLSELGLSTEGLNIDIGSIIPGLDMSDTSAFNSEDIVGLLNKYSSEKGELAGLDNGTLDLAEMFGVTSIDASSIVEAFNEAFKAIDTKTTITEKMEDIATAIDEVLPKIKGAVSRIVSGIYDPIKALTPFTWGAEIGMNLAEGLRSEIANVDSAAFDLAAAVAKYIHFSEPDEGPLSDFHTYAPDMIKLWNKGVYDNLGSVEDSSSEFGETVYDGFSTALDYVSDLINNGMSDQLTIRPIMDLSEIQNGVDSMGSILSSANGYQITGTTRLAASAAYGMGSTSTVPVDQPVVAQTDVGSTNNTFYITSNDPNAVAEKVSKILSTQTRRQKAVWAK